MSFKDFFSYYFFLILSYFLNVILFFIFFIMLHVPISFLILYLLLFSLFGFFWMFFYFFKKKKFYDNFFQILQSLDQKYLIHEMDVIPNSLETKKLLEILYLIDKSMNEHIANAKQTNQGFRDYIEMWIHEIKIPIANIVLLLHNKESNEQKLLGQLRKIEEYIEQVLYYVRSEMVEKDYVIQKHSLKSIISSVVRKNKDVFIYEEVSLDISGVSCEVLTDAKWLSFILNQILSNCFKYKQKNPKVIIWTEQFENKVELHIKDNGRGILESDLPRVFEKCFTGKNGREVGFSTGMGLYICKKLIDLLGHQIKIISKPNEFTEVIILFCQTDFYNVVS